MPHHTPLIATIVGALTAAFILGALAQRLRLPPLVGYLLAGVIVGPFTPGYVADQPLATELAEIGVILLMFGVGLHFSVKDLMSVRKIAIPGALAQMGVATLLGIGLASLFGWNLAAGLVFGLALSVASTVVLLRALQERRIVQTERGRIAVGWLIVEDLAMVLALVLLPALAQAGGSATSAGLLAALGLTLAKVGGFVAFMLIIGRRVVPAILHYVAHTGSRELFRLAVLTLALGIAFGAAALFGVSFALGAFFAGMILAESELSQRATEETLPLRDAFAVLFFVSVGMLFNPAVILRDPLPLLGVVAVIVVGKSVAALAIMKLYRRNAETSFTVAASLAQIGEFSFILAGLGVELNLMPAAGRDLILGGAIISILLNPAVFALAKRMSKAMTAKAAQDAAQDAPVCTSQTDHTVLIGYGRVGEVVARGLDSAGSPFVVVEDNDDAAEKAKAAGYECISGNAADARVLASTNIAKAVRVIVAVPDAFEAGQVVQKARKSNPELEVIARAHSDAEVEHLTALGAQVTIMGEREIAIRMLNECHPHAKAATKPRSAPATPLRPATSASLILSDAEHAVLTAFSARDLPPFQPLPQGELIEAAMGQGFSAERIGAAIEALHDKACIVDLGEDRLALTEAGFRAAVVKPIP